MKKRLTEDRIVDIVVYFLLAIVGIVTVYPFIIPLSAHSMTEWT